MPRDKVILAYSGGLDTSVMVPWIGEKYNLDVVTFTVDLGQGEDIERIRQKALRTGAVDAIARQPGAAARIQTVMIIGLALIESLVIYSLIISILLLGKIH